MTDCNKGVFEIGKVYLTVGGNGVQVVGAANEDRPDYRTVYCSGGVHRYDRQSDRGRVTGSSFDMSDSRNLVVRDGKPVELVPAPAVPESVEKIATDLLHKWSMEGAERAHDALEKLAGNV